jgi:hypothetical protein
VTRLKTLVIASFLALGGCAAAADDAASPDSAALAAAAAPAPTYYRIEATSPTATTVALVNGGAFGCPGTSSLGGKRCTVDKLVLPADCGWECQDGLLSLRGVTIVEGALDRVTDTTAHKKVSRLVARGGWDTWRAGVGSYQYYRLVPASATCSAAPCPGTLRAQRLNGAEPAHTVARVDFSHADDTNYVLDPTRGLAQASSAAGLFASGVIRDGVFTADRVLRLWTPKPACDPQQVARAHWFHGGEDVVDVEVTTAQEGETYVDSLGRTVHWLVRDAEDALSVEFVTGVNDLWAERIGIDKATCELTVLGEH